MNLFSDRPPYNQFSEGRAHIVLNNWRYMEQALWNHPSLVQRMWCTSLHGLLPTVLQVSELPLKQSHSENVRWLTFWMLCIAPLPPPLLEGSAKIRFIFLTSNLIIFDFLNRPNFFFPNATASFCGSQNSSLTCVVMHSSFLCLLCEWRHVRLFGKRCIATCCQSADEG